MRNDIYTFQLLLPLVPKFFKYSDSVDSTLLASDITSETFYKIYLKSLQI